MRKDVEKIVEIPEGVSVEMNNSEVIAKADGKEMKREFTHPNIEIKVEGNQVKVASKKATKRELKNIGTIAGHIKNMVEGFKQPFEYKLEICNVHFPMNAKVEGQEVVIKSFLGEKKDRKAKILGNVTVEIKGNDISVSSFDKEAAGQTAANIEKSARLTGRDRRIFQDGIFITEKCGREI